MDFDREILKLYREMELEMIKSMKRNFRLHLAEEGKTGIRYPQWQAKKIKALRQFQTQVLKIQNNMLMHIPEKISEHLQTELKEGAASEVRKYAGLLGQSSVILMKDSFFDVDANKITSLINSLTNDLKKANTAVLRMMNDTYRQTIFKYEMFVANGVYTEKQAYDKAVKDFLDRGINCIEYKNGRRVNIADYTSMAIRTANQRAYMVGQGEFRKQLGRTLIIISRHNTSCELCKPFENKVLIDDIYSGGTAQDGDYMLLSDAMEKGLYHPRCRHGSSTYFPELEEIEREFENRETSEESKNSSDIAYAENQEQRFKRLSQGSIDNKNIKEYTHILNTWKSKTSELKSVDKSSKNDIITSGAVSGARNPYGRAASIHAEKYYGLVRAMKTDVTKISEATGISKEEINKVKQYIFLEKHDLGNGRVDYFAPDYMMAESWQRLILGKPEKHDITLLKHELMEMQLVAQGISQYEAHIITSKKYNYSKEASEFYDKIEKYKDE